MSVESGKKVKVSNSVFTHWRRPITRTYEYNYEYGESYYKPQVRYLDSSTVRASSRSAVRNIRESISSSSSSVKESSSSSSYRTRRSGTPPGARTFMERWSSDPFYGRYGPPPSWASASEATLRSESVAREMRSLAQVRAEENTLRSQRAASESNIDSIIASLNIAGESSLAAQESLSALQASSSVKSSRTLKSSSVRSSSVVESSSAQRSSSSSALRASSESESGVCRRRISGEYGSQSQVCDGKCPVHNDPQYKRRFVLGDRLLDAAALGGFDILYDPAARTVKTVRTLRTIQEHDGDTFVTRSW